MTLRQLLDDHPKWDRVAVLVATRYAAEFHVSRKLQTAKCKVQTALG